MTNKIKTFIYWALMVFFVGSLLGALCAIAFYK